MQKKELLTKIYLHSMPVNKVIGLLNPKILEDRNGKGEISLSVDHPDKIMEMGDAIDCGKCGAKRADGSGCTNVVNTNTCEFCTFHVQKAYKNMSAKRPDLQSAFSGGGDARSRIMSKIDPKGRIFFRLLEKRTTGQDHLVPGLGHLGRFLSSI